MEVNYISIEKVAVFDTNLLKSYRTVGVEGILSTVRVGLFYLFIFFEGTHSLDLLFYGHQSDYMATSPFLIPQSGVVKHTARWPKPMNDEF